VTVPSSTGVSPSSSLSVVLVHLQVCNVQGALPLASYTSAILLARYTSVTCKGYRGLHVTNLAPTPSPTPVTLSDGVNGDVHTTRIHFRHKCHNSFKFAGAKCAPANTHTHAHTHTLAHIHLHTHKQTHTHTHTHTRARAHTHTQCHTHMFLANIMMITLTGSTQSFCQPGPVSV